MCKQTWQAQQQRYQQQQQEQQQQQQLQQRQITADVMSASIRVPSCRHSIDLLTPPSLPPSHTPLLPHSSPIPPSFLPHFLPQSSLTPSSHSPTHQDTHPVWATLLSVGLVWSGLAWLFVLFPLRHDELCWNWSGLVRTGALWVSALLPHWGSFACGHADYVVRM
jgi:hypothetical protein